MVGVAPVNIARGNKCLVTDNSTVSDKRAHTPLRPGGWFLTDVSRNFGGMFDIIHAFSGTTAFNATTPHGKNPESGVKVKFRVCGTIAYHH